MFPKIKQVVDKIDLNDLTAERKKDLDILVEFVQTKQTAQAPILLNFICTHNSRRSQFAQIWAQVAADYYHIEASCFSGGVEVTAFNERAVASLKRFGFEIEQAGATNPVYTVEWANENTRLDMWSKLFDNEKNPTSNFAAIMTCSHADENCPFVAGCEKRIAVRYEDPKNYDDSPLETAFYDYRSFQIATEMFYVFSKIKK
ncbi:protein-tyrosine-phosphatase [Putridiphycobacter roseus]|uniref:Protein-tyrosine-phosphatase n=1 Tax=Putridiphycobacter roseus TaxID=2219161 RepID=A0A2W1N0P8_9FLAO|nr:protein-tyrosine-phosphatase [Putridiphycobacter roseus]PZE18159.1 protein-tyrosine-phosphatase [Putridiphycobacter roseus]